MTPKKRIRRNAGWIVLGAVVVAWWLSLAPTGIGGPAGFAVASGTSMEPSLVTGDLVVTHRQDTYMVGDVVVFEADGGRVVHRIVGGSAEQGWTTQGDNRVDADAWVVGDDDIVGRQWATVPGFSDRLSFLGAWWAPPGAAAFVALVLLWPRRARHNPTLEAALTLRQARSWRTVTPPSEVAALVGAAVCGLVSLLVAVRAADLGVGGALAVPIGATALAGSVSVAFYLRLFHGWGLPEPRRSFAIFGSDLVALTSAPTLTDTPEPTGPRVLARTARDERVPVLHVHDGSQHRFLVLLADRSLECVVLDGSASNDEARTETLVST